MEVVKVHWDDASSLDAWSDEDTLKSWGITCCETVGFLVVNEKDHVVIASSLNTEGHYANCTNIPRKQITAMLVYRVPSDG